MSETEDKYADRYSSITSHVSLTGPVEAKIDRDDDGDILSVLIEWPASYSNPPLMSLDVEDARDLHTALGRLLSELG